VGKKGRTSTFEKYQKMKNGRKRASFQKKRNLKGRDVSEGVNPLPPTVYHQGKKEKGNTAGSGVLPHRKPVNQRNPGDAKGRGGITREHT